MSWENYQPKLNLIQKVSLGWPNFVKGGGFDDTLNKKNWEWEYLELIHLFSFGSTASAPHAGFDRFSLHTPPSLFTILNLKQQRNTVQTPGFSEAMPQGTLPSSSISFYFVGLTCLISIILFLFIFIFWVVLDSGFPFFFF